MFGEIWCLVYLRCCVHFLELSNPHLPTDVLIEDAFCSYPAFVFAFITLILHWILFPLVLFWECMIVGNVFQAVLSLCGWKNKSSYFSTQRTDPSV